MVDNNANWIRRKWKGLSWDYDTILEQENNSSTWHCLSATTVMLLSSIVDYIGWYTRYDGSNIDKDKIDLWAAKAAYELGGVMLRKDGCKLEMSCDGVNWVTVMDLAECGGNQAIASSQTYETNITVINNDYTGTPESIDCPDVVYDVSPDDEYRDTALCFAIRGFVEATARAWVTKDQGDDSRNRLIASVGVLVGGGVLAAFTLATGGIGSLVAGALGSAIALAAINIDLDDETQLYAPEVIDAVSCCMYRALRGATPTQIAFQNSLDGCTFDVDSYEEKLQEIMQAIVEPLDTYLSFLKMWNEYFEYADNGLIENQCDECITGAWVATCPMDTEFIPALVGTSNPPAGDWVQYEGFTSRCETTGSDRTTAKVEVTAPTSYEQTKVVFYYTLSICGGQIPAFQGAIDVHIGTPPVDTRVDSRDFGELLTGVRTWVHEGEYTINTIVEAFMYSCYYNCGGDVVFTKVVIEGTGDCPFDGQFGWSVVYG